MARPPRRAGLPVVGLRDAHFWRCIPRRYLKTVLEPGPSFTGHRRYSIRGEFGALYFSASRDLSLAEATARTGEDSELMCSVEFKITAGQVVDLTRPEARTALRVRREDLVHPRTSANAYEVPQRVARQVYQERLSGLLAPSVYDPYGEKQRWFNLVLYPANLVRAFIREIDVSDLSFSLR
jgi:RES domain-containing protein